MIDSRLGRLAASILAAVAAVASVRGVHSFLVMTFSLFTDSAWIKAAILERTGNYDDIALVIRGPVGWPLAPLCLAAFVTAQLAFNPRTDKNKILAPTVLLAVTVLLHSFGTYYACYGLMEILSGEFTFSGQAVGWNRLMTEGGMFFVKSFAVAGYTVVSIWIVIVWAKLSLERAKHQKQIQLKLKPNERNTIDSHIQHHDPITEEHSAEMPDKPSTLSN